MKVYLAGKIGRHDWRHSIVPRLDKFSGDNDTNQLSVIEGGVAGGHDYVGPFFLSLGGHGEGHGWAGEGNTHGRGLGGFADFGLSHLDLITNQESKGQVFMYCAIQIERADLVFAWLDETTAYGTLVEIGMARAQRKAIWVAGYPNEDLWFAFCAATQVRFVQSSDEDAKTAWLAMLDRHGSQLEDDLRADREWSAHLIDREKSLAEFVGYAKRNRPNTLRADVWSKTGGKCWYCGIDLNPFKNFHVEHMQPKSKGGTDALDNLVPACSDCNLSKGGLSVNEFRWRRGVTKFWFEQAGISVA